MLKESGGGYSDMTPKFTFSKKEELFPKMLKVLSEGVPELSALFEDCLC